MKKLEWIFPIASIIFVVLVLIYIIPIEEEILNNIRYQEVHQLKKDNEKILMQNKALQIELSIKEGKVECLQNSMDLR